MFRMSAIRYFHGQGNLVVEIEKVRGIRKFRVMGG